MIYDALHDEKRPWFKWPVATGGFFVSHWILDLTPCYHDMDWPFDTFQWFILLFNLAFIAFLWWASRSGGRWRPPPPRVLWGVFGGWLLWDVWWLIDPAGGPHRLLVAWGRVLKWRAPESFLLEGLFIALATLLSLPAIDQWWKTSAQAQSLKHTLGRAFKRHS